MNNFCVFVALPHILRYFIYTCEGTAMQAIEKGCKVEV